MPVRTVAIDLPNPAPYNPRVDLQAGSPRYERIKRSLDRFGLVEPLVMNERSGNLVGGHQRLKILKARGDTEVEVFVGSWDETEEKALNLVLNSPDIEGEWVKDALDRVLADVEAGAPDIFDELELHTLSHLEIEESEAAEAARLAAEGAEVPKNGPAEMELLPYESYDYIMLMFKDSRDFIAAIDHFGIKRVSVPAYVGSKKIGLGRVIDGAKYLKKIRHEDVLSPVLTPQAAAEEVLADPAAVDQAFAAAEHSKKKK